MRKLIIVLVAVVVAVFAMNTASASATSLAGTKMDRSIVDRFQHLLGTAPAGQTIGDDTSAVYDLNCFRTAGYNKIYQRSYFATARLTADNYATASASTLTINTNGQMDNFRYYEPMVDPAFNRSDIQDYRLDNPRKAA